MALPRANAPARSCLRLLASSQQPALALPRRQLVASSTTLLTRTTVLRSFSSSLHLLKKRKIAAASNSPKGAPADNHDAAAASPSSSKASQANPDDPLDMSPVTAAYAPIDVHFRAQLAAMVHGGRFNPTNLGSLPVAVKDEASGAPASFPLRELAQVVPRSGRSISLLVNDKAYIKPIMSAVQASKEFNQQPQRSEDNELELLLKVELERKDEVSRRIKEVCQQWRERVRQARTKHEKVLKDWKKNGTVLPDIVKKAEKELQKVQDKKMKEIDQEEAKTTREL